MTKQEFLNMGWNGLFVMFNDNPFKIYGIEEGSVKLVGSNDFIRTSIKNVTPAIRHLDTLTQECVQADYNNGEPFIPIVELAKIAFNVTTTADYELSFRNNEYKVVFKQGNKFISALVLNVNTFIFLSHTCTNNSYINNQLQLFQQLLKWHFWPNKPEGEEVIYVSETFNPYK